MALSVGVLCAVFAFLIILFFLLLLFFGLCKHLLWFLCPKKKRRTHDQDPFQRDCARFEYCKMSCKPLLLLLHCYGAVIAVLVALSLTHSNNSSNNSSDDNNSRSNNDNNSSNNIASHLMRQFYNQHWKINALIAPNDFPAAFSCCTFCNVVVGSFLWCSN